MLLPIPMTQPLQNEPKCCLKIFRCFQRNLFMPSKVLWAPLLALSLSPVYAQTAPGGVPLPPGPASNSGYIARAQHRVLKPGPISARAYVLMDLDSGRVLESRNPNQRMFPASTTKTMTALLAIEKGDLDSVLTIGPNPPKIGESSIHLLQGEKFLLRDLVKAAMIKSANDSCVAIAEGVAGSVPAFAQMMNAEAKKLGARNTNFVNPHGLHDPEHYTTAYDLALIARRALKNPFFNKVVATQEAKIHGNWKIGPNRLLLNRNRLLFRWAACDGVKTGYTRQAGRCLIASATRIDPSTGKKWRLLSVVLFAGDTVNDSYNLLALHGFQKYAPTTLAAEGQSAAKLEPQGGAEPTEAIVSREVRWPLRRDEQSTLTREAVISKVTAPVKQGQIVGYWRISASGRKLMDVPLVAKEAVPASLAARMLPGSSSFLPADPSRRWLGIGLLVGSLALLLSAWKLRARPRRSAAKRPRVPSKNSGVKKYELQKTVVSPVRRSAQKPQRRSQRHEARREAQREQRRIETERARRLVAQLEAEKRHERAQHERQDLDQQRLDLASHRDLSASKPR
jgi:D-alanyl-D-alanine carboxypeptidase (penicillin-binding protein 5/6)